MLIPSSIPIVTPPTPSSQTAAHLHWLDELFVTLATGPGSCPAPLARLKGCHFLIDSGLSLVLCSRFPIWQQSPLFGAKPYERREKGEHTLLSFKGNLKFKWTKQKVYLSPGVALCLVGLLILRRAILIDLVQFVQVALNVTCARRKRILRLSSLKNGNTGSCRQVHVWKLCLFVKVF